MGYNSNDMNTENEIGYKYHYESQERMEWYHINAFLQAMGKAATDLELKPEDMVHIGGTANFFRLYQAYGPVAVARFRGTHDMDTIGFTQGKVQQVLERVKAMPNSPISGFTIGRAVGLPDKKSAYINFAETNDPKLSTGFEMDIYESSTGVIRFNNRMMNKNKIVLDPPESIELPEHRGLVGVPSLRDNFVIKMDIIDYSRSGLRPKDKLDVLVTMGLCDKVGTEFIELIDALRQTSTPESFKEKLTALEGLLLRPFQDIERAIDPNYPFLPSPEQTRQGLGIIRQCRTMSPQRNAS